MYYEAHVEPINVFFFVFIHPVYVLLNIVIKKASVNVLCVIFYLFNKVNSF